jgi:hypothetical protein
MSFAFFVLDSGAHRLKHLLRPRLGGTRTEGSHLVPPPARARTLPPGSFPALQSSRALREGKESTFACGRRLQMGVAFARLAGR